MRNTVAKNLRNLSALLGKNKAYYRRLKRTWNTVPRADRHEIIATLEAEVKKEAK